MGLKVGLNGAGHARRDGENEARQLAARPKLHSLESLQPSRGVFCLGCDAPSAPSANYERHEFNNSKMTQQIRSRSRVWLVFSFGELLASDSLREPACLPASLSACLAAF